MVVGKYSLNVSCGFNSSMYPGYTVLVQSAGAQNFTVLFYEASQSGSPVMVARLTEGLYYVVVFPLTKSGIVGSDAAFTEQVIVPRPPSPIIFSRPLSYIFVIIIVLSPSSSCKRQYGHLCCVDILAVGSDS